MVLSIGIIFDIHVFHLLCKNGKPLAGLLDYTGNMLAYGTTPIPYQSLFTSFITIMYSR